MEKTIYSLGELTKKYDAVVFFDTETTGLDPKENRVIELAMIRVNKEGIAEKTYDRFVKIPEGDGNVPERITQLTGITDADLLEGVEEKEMAEAFSEFLEGKTLLVAHNAQFDLNFIGWTFVRTSGRHLEQYEPLTRLNAADYLDSMTVYRDRATQPHRLKNAITHYGLDRVVQNTHRAIDDTLALAAVTEAMTKERDDLDQYVNIFGYQEKYGISYAKLKKVTYKVQRNTMGMRETERTLPRI